MTLRVTILGSGTSFGVPVIGCECAVCRSTDPRNQRLRTMALLQVGQRHILIDAGPDLRAQALRAGLRQLDAVLLTHSHEDHIGGIDDLRAFNHTMQRPIPLYGNQETLAHVRERFDYAFNASSAGSTKPSLELCCFDGPFSVADVPVRPLPVLHGTWPIHGFRVGKLAYITDASAIPASTCQMLCDLDVLILNALRYEPHPTHFSLAEALEQIAALRPRRAYLTHLTHAFDHATVERDLPPGVQLAYDGLCFDVA